MNRTMDREPVLQLHKISKSFPGVEALKSVDFSLYPGEVHVLAGENGAGKSTLLKCILGIYAPEEGQILFRGREVHFRNTGEAIGQGIGAVYQELTMIPWLDAAQNIFFGKEPVIPGTSVIASREMYRDARRILDQLHCGDIDLHVPVKTLSVARQQMIEIAKALTLHPKVLLFDEPTTSLTSRETDFLFEQIRYLKEQGIAILYISHRMSEIHKIGDRITILRDGRWISTDPTKDLTEEQIIQRMIGRELGEISHEGRSGISGKPVLTVTDLCDRKGKVRNCSLELYQGEIVGLAGMVGSGRTELARLIYGIDPVSSGVIRFHGKQYTTANPIQMVGEGMGFLPEDRKHSGLALGAPVHWNILAASLKKYFPQLFLSGKKSIRVSDSFVDRLKIQTPDSRRAAEELSGGNQQKVVLAKWLSADAKVFIFDEPTKGIDVGARQEIYQLLNTLADQGKSILVISSDMEELIRVSDRIYCLKEGQINGMLDRTDFSQTAIGNRILSDRAAEDPEQTPEGQKRETGGKILSGILSAMPPAFYMSLLLILFFGMNAKHFLSFSNLGNVTSQAAASLVLTCGQSLILLTQGTDLSLGTMVSFLGVWWFFLLNSGIPLPFSILLCLLGGALCGLINGVIVAKGKIPVFIVTLGTQNIFRSMALLLCGSQTLYHSTPVFRFMARQRFCGFTYITWIAVFSFLLTVFLIRKTRFGMRVRGIGGNPQGVLFSGTGMVSNQIKVFVYAGIMAAVSALILCCRIESGNPNAGSGMEFNSIAAALLGGISMREGKGRVETVIFGVLLIQILRSGLAQIGMSSTYQNATIGLVVLIAIVIDAVLKRMEGNRGI